MNKDTLNTAVNARKAQIDRMNTAGAESIQSTSKMLDTEPSANAGVFTFKEWQPDIFYEMYDIFSYIGNVYFAKQDFTSSSVYPPDSVGVEALYGIRPSPDIYGIYPYIQNMAVAVGMKVRSTKDGNVYICYANATNTLIYDPADVPAIFELV